MANLDNAQKAVDELRVLLRQKKGVRLTQATLKSAFSKLDEIKAFLESEPVLLERAPDDEAQAKSIDEFFEAVGSGTRKAQEKLDLQSVEYLKKRPAFAPETMFRVPKVSANLKLGMTVTEEKGINFMVIKKGTESSRTIEQEISFDIVSAPPPPDTLEGIAELPIPPVLITNAFERDRVFNRLRLEKKRMSDHDPEVSELINAILRANNSRRVLVFRGADSWTLMLVAPADERSASTEPPSHSAKVLTLPVDEEDKKLRRLRPNQRMNHFYELLYPIADEQAELLKTLERA